MRQPVITTAPEPLRPRLRDQRPLLQRIAITIGLVLLVALLIDGPLMWALILPGLCYAAFLGYRLNQALQPPVMGTETYQSAAKPAKEEAAVFDMPPIEETPSPAIEAAARMEDGEPVLWEERAHFMLLLEYVVRALPTMLGLWGFAALQPIVAGMSSDQDTTLTLLIAVMVACCLMLVASFAKKLQWVSRRTLWGVLVVTAALTFSVARVEALVLITLILFLAGGYLLLRTWAKWYYSHIIVTRTRLKIGYRSPRLFLMKEEGPSVSVKKLTSMNPVKSVPLRLLGLHCGSVRADTSGQQDAFVHNMRWVKDHEGLAALLNKLTG